MITKQKRSKILNTGFSFDFQITDNLKKQIVDRFKSVSQETLVGYALYRFSLTADYKTDADFQHVLNAMFSQINDEPLVMRQILGSNFHYFKDLLLHQLV